MKRLSLLMLLSLITFVTMADPGFNYRKHYKKAKMSRKLDRLFNRNKCYGKSYNNIR
jgi:hypothetical protein